MSNSTSAALSFHVCSSFRVGITIIDGADDVFSLRRKELFWQYRLQTFSPKGLNERAADVELDIFACGGTA